MKFDGEFIVSDQQQGRIAIDIEATTHTGTPYEYGVWIARTETGLYDLTVMGTDVELVGSAKLDSLPHLALLATEDAKTQLTVTVFQMPEVFGIRGFLKSDDHMYTFEVALKPLHETAQGDNVIQFRPRRRN